MLGVDAFKKFLSHINAYEIKNGLIYLTNYIIFGNKYYQ